MVLRFHTIWGGEHNVQVSEYCMRRECCVIWIRGRWEKLLTMKTKYNRKHKLIPVILHVI
jgi:hypothetical protein